MSELVAQPTPQEQLLMAMDKGAFGVAVRGIERLLAEGRTPSILSVVRSEVLCGFAEEWHAHSRGTGVVQASENYKDELFATYLAQARAGGIAALGALPKFAQNPGQLSLALDLALDSREALAAYQADTKHLQYLGSFDPQHIGHRIAVASALDSAGDKAHAVVHVMGGHPRKKSFSASYDERFATSERRFYDSSLINNTQVTQIDVPGGVGLATANLAQMELIANASGDAKLRWVIGSDKLQLDAGMVRADTGKAAKAILRFTDPRMHVYVVHRKTEQLDMLRADVAYVQERFGTPISLVEERPYDCAPASSSRIKELRAAGNTAAADHMEFYELVI